MQPQAQKISIVVPLLNEEESLGELYSQISTTLESLKCPYEIIFIDDGSTDNSLQVLRELHKKDASIQIISFRKNNGKSAALAMGFKEATGEIIITLDADLQDDPSEIPKLIEEINSGFDLVSGWKKNRNDPFIKRHTSKLYNWVTRRLAGLTIHDINCGIKAYRREVTESLNVYGQLHRFLPVMAQWEGFRVGEIVVKHHPRKFGRTKFGLSRFAAGFFDLITVLFITRYTKRPLHLFGFIGMLSFIFGIAISLYLAYERLFLQIYLSNRPLLFLGILAIIVGVQFISIGLLGEMITESKKGKIDYPVKFMLKKMQ